MPTAISASACCRSWPRAPAARCRPGRDHRGRHGLARPRQGLFRRPCAQFDEQAFHRALIAIWEVIADANRYVDAQAPWALAKTGPARRDTVLWVLAETIRRVTLLVQPFMPDSGAGSSTSLLSRQPTGRLRASTRSWCPARRCRRRKACSRATSSPQRRQADADRQPLPSRFPRARDWQETGVLARARTAGVAGMLTIGTRLDQFDKVPMVSVPATPAVRARASTPVSSVATGGNRDGSGCRSASASAFAGST